MKKKNSLILSVVVDFAAVILAHECMHSQLFFNIISCAHTFSVPHCFFLFFSAAVETVLADADNTHIQRLELRKPGLPVINTWFCRSMCVFSEVLTVRVQKE